MCNPHGQCTELEDDLFEKAKAGNFKLRSVHKCAESLRVGTAWKGSMSLVLVRDNDQLTFGLKTVLCRDGSQVEAVFSNRHIGHGIGESSIMELTK